MNEEEQEALLDEAKAVHVSEPESDELLDIATGLEQDEDYNEQEDSD